MMQHITLSTSMALYNAIEVEHALGVLYHAPPSQLAVYAALGAVQLTIIYVCDAQGDCQEMQTSMRNTRTRSDALSSLLNISVPMVSEPQTGTTLQTTIALLEGQPVTAAEASSVIKSAVGAEVVHITTPVVQPHEEEIVVPQAIVITVDQGSMVATLTVGLAVWICPCGVLAMVLWRRHRRLARKPHHRRRLRWVANGSPVPPILATRMLPSVCESSVSPISPSGCTEPAMTRGMLLDASLRTESEGRFHLFLSHVWCVSRSVKAHDDSSHPRVLLHVCMLWTGG
jgi:hypothetical protein